MKQICVMSTEVMNKRAVLVAAGAPLVMEEKPVHSTPPHGVVVKVHYAGVCHSDVHLWQDKIMISDKASVPMISQHGYPFVLGHEISGEIYSIGKDVCRSDLSVGDKVVCFAWLGCKQCAICRSGDENMCSAPGRGPVGCSKPEGGYQEYVAMKSADDVLKVAPTLGLDVACMLGCAALTAYNALSCVKPTIEKAVRLQGTASLLIIGTGGLGQWGITLGKEILPKECKIICADISEEKVSVGLNTGADDSIVWPLTASETEIEERSRKVCHTGVHGVVDFVNNTTTIGRAFKLAVKGGVLAQVGIYGGDARNVPLGLLALKGLSINGIVTGSRGQLREVIDIVAAKNICPPPITKISLEEASSYLVHLQNGDVKGRALIEHVSSSA